MNPNPEVIRQRLLTRTRLRHWLGFARVCELGSVRKAATSIGLAQPALSSLLAELEGLVGAPLFERHVRGMRLTPLGGELLPVAKMLLGAVDKMAEQAAALQWQAQSVVRAGAISGAMSGLLSIALPALSQRQPSLLVQLVEADAPRLEELVARGEVDMALCREPLVVPQGWRFEPLLTDRFVVVARAGHALARCSRVSLAQLGQETWLAMPAGSAARIAFDRLFEHTLPRPALCQVSCRVPAILWAMLKAQPLLALVPASVTHQLVAAAELVELPIACDLPFNPIGALVAVDEARGAVLGLLSALQDVERAKSALGTGPP